MDVDERVQAIFARLVEANIEIIPTTEIPHHIVFARDEFAALVRMGADGSFVSIGGAGKVTDRGLAPLIERNGQHLFAVKEFQEPATADDVARVRQFNQDLTAALRG